jgi:hypothetical protein
MSTVIDEKLKDFSEDSIYYFQNRIDSIVKDEDWYRKFDLNTRSRFHRKVLAAWYHQSHCDGSYGLKPLDAFVRDWARE